MAESAPITPKHGWHVGDDNPMDWIVKTAGVVVNITGYSVEWVLRDDRDAPQNRLRYTDADAELAIPTGTDGKITLDVTDTATDGFMPGRYYYYLKRNGVGVEKTLAEGPVDLQRGL